MIPDFDAFDFNHAVVGRFREAAQRNPHAAALGFQAPLAIAETLAAMPDADYVRFVSGYMMMMRPYPVERLRNEAVEQALLEGWSADWMAPYTGTIRTDLADTGATAADPLADTMWHAGHAILGLVILQRLARAEITAAMTRGQLSAQGAETIASLCYEALTSDAIAGRVRLRPTQYMLQLLDGGDVEFIRVRAVMHTLSGAVTSLGTGPHPATIRV
ncbi:hypothetical protein [Azospirillum sp. sgz302134]